MKIIECLEAQYPWKNIRMVDDKLIETEHGLKRIRYWSDETLLDWHFSWRDSLQVTPYVLADRMIRTKENQNRVRYADGWLTVHDEIVEPFVNEKSERQIGAFIRAMIEYGLKSESTVTTLDRRERRNRSLQEFLATLPKEQQVDLQFYLDGADFRMKKVSELEEQVKLERLPRLDPIRSIHQLRRFHKIAIWYGTTEFPEYGFSSLSQFLREWFEEYGLRSTKELVEEILAGLTREQAIQLLIECMRVTEFDPLFDTVITERNFEALMRKLEKDWKVSKQLVTIVSMTIDSKKKVMAE